MDSERTAFKNLVDLNKLKTLLESFSAATGFTTGLLDHSTNKILFGTGWRDICINFHRAFPEAKIQCKASNKELISKSNHAGDICIHHCQHGFVDGCTPVIVQGKHYADLFTGQLLFSPPDKELFRKQARKYGFNEKQYLESLAAVPVVSEEKFRATLYCLANIVSMFIENALANLDTRRESNRKEALLQSIFKSAPVGIGFVVNRVIQWTNHRMSEICGYTSSELEGQEASMLYPSEEEFERVGRIKYGQIKEKDTGSVDTRFKRKDGSIVDVHVSSTPMNPQDLNAGVTFTVLDITERKKAEEQLLRSRNEWERTFNAMPDIVTIQDKNLSIIRANRAACTALNLPRNEIIGQRCFSFFRGSKEPCQACPLHSTKKNSLPCSREVYHKKMGKTFLVSAAPVFDEQGEFEYIIHVAKDISKFKKLEEDRVRLAAAINQAAETVVITDEKGNIQYVNPAFEKLTGYSREEAIGQNPRILKSDEHDRKFYQSMWNKLFRGEVWKGHLINKRKNGSLFEEEATISPVKNNEGQITNFVAVKRDVTRERSLEKQLRQAMKMEAIGTLAGGIAHDFNNILTAMIGFSEIAREQLPVDNPIRNDLDQVLIAGDRAADLVQQILTFSRQGEEKLKPVKIQFIIKEVLKLLRSSLPATISLKESIDTNCGMILADPTQIHQVLMDLSTNAKHAIGEEPGTISISLSQKQVTKTEPIDNCPHIVNGTYLDLTISDTGCGMDVLTRAKIFDPFFTTKEKEKGTGLGLAVVHGIIKQHKGEITVASEPGKGTIFHIYLPVLAQKEAQAEQIIFEDIPLGKGERILFVDDETAVTNIMSRILESLGYIVIAFTSSIDALEAYQKNPAGFDLVITDMSMPGMTGIDLSRKLLAIEQNLPVVLCTGFNETNYEMTARSLGIREYLKKPVDKYTLAKAINKALIPS